MKRVLFSTVLPITIIVALIACGGKADKKENTDTKETTEQTATAKDAAAAGNANDCGTTSINFATEKVKDDDFTIKHSEAKLWEMASGETKYPAIVVQVANYTMEGSYLQEPKSSTEMRVVFTLSGKSGEKLKLGEYDIAGNVGFGAGYGLSGGIETNEKNEGFMNATGKATITYLSADKVCGTIDVKDSKTFIKGSFSLPLEKSLY